MTEDWYYFHTSKLQVVVSTDVSQLESPTRDFLTISNLYV